MARHFNEIGDYKFVDEKMLPLMTCDLVNHMQDESHCWTQQDEEDFRSQELGESHVQQSYCWTDDSFLTFLHFSFPEASSILILLLPLSVVLIRSSLRLPSAAQVSLITIPSSSLSHSHTEGIVLFPHTRTRARSHCSFIFISIFKFITFSSAVLGGNWALTYNGNLH